MSWVVYRVVGTAPDGEAVEEYFFSKELAEWADAAYRVKDNPHDFSEMPVGEAIDRYHLYFCIMWIDGKEYREEVWKDFGNAHERVADLLFEEEVIEEQTFGPIPRVEMRPLPPAHVDLETVRDVH